MKRFLTAISFFILAGVGYAQQCIDVQLTPTAGTCYSDATLKVVATPKSPAPAGCALSGSYMVELTKPKGAPTYQAMSGSPATYQFNDLAEGMYTVTVTDPSGSATAVKSVYINSSYKLMNITDLKTIAPSCAAQYDGQIQFKIPSGGIGPFLVSVEDGAGHQLVAPVSKTRPSGSNYITIQGTASERLEANKTVVVVVKDQGGPTSLCGEERRITDVVIPAVDGKAPGCYEIKIRFTTLEPDLNCKYKLGITLDRKSDNKSVDEDVTNKTAVNTYFNNRAKIEYLNPASKGSFNPPFSGSTYNTGYVFEPGDKIRITINGGKNTIVHEIEFPQSIFKPTTCGFGMSAQDRSVNTCGTTPTLKWEMFRDFVRKDLTDMRTGSPILNYMYYFQYAYANGNFVAEKKNAAGQFVGPVGTWVSRDVVDLTASGAGTYRFKFRHPNGCYEICTREYNVKPASTTLNRVFDDLKQVRGVFEGTGGFVIEALSTEFNFPLTINLKRADGKTSYSFATRLPFGETETKTITFPLTQTANASGRNRFGWGDLPAGKYIIEIKDNCNNTVQQTIDINLLRTQKDTFSESHNCSNGSVTYDVGFLYKIPDRVHVELMKESSPGVYISTGQIIKNPKSAFNNILAGKYALKVKNLYYELANGDLFMQLETTAINGVGVNGKVYNHSAQKPFEIKRTNPLEPVITSTACSASSGSGIIVADVTGQNVVYPLTFNLYKASAPTTIFRTKTLQATDPDNTFWAFNNLADGQYIVQAQHQCQVSPGANVEVKINAAFNPPITISSQPRCKGDNAVLNVGLSENLFDIRWFELTAGGTRKTSTPIATGRSYSQVISETTTFEVEYQMRANVGCGATTPRNKRVTVNLPVDTTPPTISRCPANITLVATAGKCSAKASWGEPTATDTCQPITVSRNYASGYEFPVGVTTVVYTFTDPAGNVATCSFAVTVNSSALKMDASARYTNTSGAPITALTPGEEFIYEIRYRNTGAQAIGAASLTVTLPDATIIQRNGNVNTSGAKQGSAEPTASYNAGTNSYIITIPAATLGTGTAERVIKIPLKHKGSCADAQKPCGNYFEAAYSLSYGSSTPACSVAPQAKQGTNPMNIDTSGCTRQEVFCGSPMNLTAEQGFDSYQWYVNGTLSTGQTTYQFIGANTAGTYSVVKTKNCNGRNLTSTETIQFDTVSTTTDPIRAQAGGVGAECAGDGSWTSHFYLCNGSSKNLTVSYVNTQYKWQKWNGSCTESSANCRNTNDGCWGDLHSNPTFTINSSSVGKYRLKFDNAGCTQYYYFEVFNNGLSGSVSDIIHETNFSRGSVKLQLNSTGVTYNIKVYTSGGSPYKTLNITTNETRITDLAEGTYRIVVTSPQIPNCEYTDNFTIEKRTTMTMKAKFISWKDCNTARFRFEAEGGKPTYRFFIWAVDGVQRYANGTTAVAPSNTPIATQGVTDTYAEADVPGITQVGEYKFIVGDTQNGAFAISNPVTVIPPSPHSFTISATQEIKCESSPNAGNINVIFDVPNQNRTVNLYQLKADGTRSTTTAYKTSNGGLFTGLAAGTYEVEILAPVGGTMCTYTKKPITIAPPKDPLKAYVAVLEDKSCSTQTPKMYKVAVTNVHGGTPPYTYSFDGEATYGAANIDYMGSSGTVYVKDNNGCRVELPVVMTPNVEPTVDVSVPTYRCDTGSGVVTVTITNTTASQTYEYTIDSDPRQTLTGTTFTRELTPGTHTLTVYYEAVSTNAAYNAIFREDFGKGVDLDVLPQKAISDVIVKVVSTSLGSINFTDPTGGRYAYYDSQLSYNKDIDNIQPNQPLKISFDISAYNHTSASSFNLSAGLYKSDGTFITSKNISGLYGNAYLNGWTKKEFNFTAAEMAGITDNKVRIKISSTVMGATSFTYMLDNIAVSQPTRYCENKVEKLINIERGKEMRLEAYGTPTPPTCNGGNDGTMLVRVVNPSSNNIKYSIDPLQATWSPTTLNAQGVFTVTGLSATQTGTLAVQDATNPACVVTLSNGYKVSEPSAITPKVVQTQKVTCFAAGTAVVRLSASGGTPASTGYKYNWTGPVTGNAGPSVNPVDATGLAAGVYTLTVTDSNNCATTTTFEIKDKAILSATAEPLSYCYATGAQKQVLINVLSGNGNYSVKRVGGLNNYVFAGNSYTFPEDLTAGAHTFVVTDGFGCTTTVSTEIYDVLELTVSPTSQQYASCKGTPVSYTLTAKGGITTMAKTFRVSTDNGLTWTNIATHPSTATYNTTAVGTTQFRFQVTYQPDGSECKAENFVTLQSDPPRLTIGALRTKNATCGKANGELQLTKSDYHVGTQSHTVEVLDGGGAVQSATALAAGTYTLRITDDRGCVMTQTFTIGSDPMLQISARVTKEIGCTSNDADIAVKLISGGKAPYEVTIENKTFGGVKTQNIPTQASGFDVPFTGLNYGTYSITVVDANGCETHTDLVVNPNVATMTFRANPQNSCATTNSMFVGISAGTANVSLTSNVYFTVYRAGLQNPVTPPHGNVLTTNNTVIAGGVDTWYKGQTVGGGLEAEILNLIPGVKYTFVIYNADTKCRYTQEATMPVNTKSTLVPTGSASNTTCAGATDGKFNYTISQWQAGTTQIQWRVFDYNTHQQVDAGTISTGFGGATITGATNASLPAGSYYIVFTESPSNCTNAYHFDVKKSAVQLKVQMKAFDKATCNTLGKAWLNIEGGTATYTYGWVASGSPYTPSVMTRTTTQSQYINMPDGTWDVYVEDAYGCRQMANVVIGKELTPDVVSATAMMCEAYGDPSGLVPVKITLSQVGQGSHYYSLDGAADQPIVWTEANRAFELKVTPVVSHTVVVKDVNGCADTITFTTTTLITATATVTKVKTCAAPTAQITVAATGGTGNYKFTLERLDNGSNPTETLYQDVALPAGGIIPIAAPATEGRYRISLYDSETENCPIVKEVELRDPVQPNVADAVVDGTDEQCNLGLGVAGTGSIQITIPTDADSYTFQITNAVDNTTGTPLAGFTPPMAPSTSASHQATFNNLHGTVIGVEYTIKVTSAATGCEALVTKVLYSAEPLTLEEGVITATQYECAGAGAMAMPKITVDTAKIKGGKAPYITEFYKGGTLVGTGTEYTLTDLNGGTFYVTVKDASGACTTNTKSVTVAPAFELKTVSVTSTQSITCSQLEEVTITANVAPAYIAGTPLRFMISSNNGYSEVRTVSATTINLTGAKGLPVGNYTIEVVNEKTGCSITGVYQVKNPNTFEVEALNPVRAQCHNDFGAITLRVVDKDLSNGDQSTNGFTYTITSISNPSMTPLTGTVAGNVTTITGQLKGGSYDIVATVSGVGCNIPATRFTIPSNPAEMKIEAKQKVSVDCANQNGVASVYVVGGQETYTITLTNAATGVTHTQSDVTTGSPGVEFGGLDAGTYNITIKDALGCTQVTGTLSVTIDPYNGINTSTISVTTQSITCVDAKDGKLRIEGVQGGTRPYHYILVRTSATGSQLPPVATNDDHAEFTGIEPGTYRIDIVDAKNCSITLAGTYQFDNPTPITADINTTASSFYTCYGTNNGSVVVHNIAGGTGSYTVDIIRADTKQKITTGHTGVAAGSSELFDNLSPTPAGTFYQVVIADTNKCTMTRTLSFTVQEFPDIAINYVEQEGTCEANTNNFKDFLVVSFRNKNIDFTNITYSLNGGPATTFTRTVGNIAYIDNYNRGVRSQTIEVTYTAVAPLTGVCTSTKDFSVVTMTALALTQVSNTAMNTIEVKATGGITTAVKGYTYYFNGVSQDENPVYKLRPRDPERVVGDVHIKIIEVKVEDAEGCTRTMTIEQPYIDLFIPNNFTPNGDGENDTWKPENVENNMNTRIHIYDRYGRRLKTLKPGEGWDGKYDGKEMPSGDYWYIVELNDELYDKREFYGNFTLYR